MSPSPFPDFFGWFFKDQVKSCLHEAFPYSPIKPSLISPFFRPLQHLRVHAACFRLCVLFANCFLSVTTKLYLLQGEGLLFFIVVSAVSSVNLVGIVVVCFGQETHYRIVLRYVSTSQWCWSSTTNYYNFMVLKIIRASGGRLPGGSKNNQYFYQNSH